MDVHFSAAGHTGSLASFPVDFTAPSRTSIGRAFACGRSLAKGEVSRRSLASQEKDEFAQELILRGLIDPTSLGITKAMRDLELPSITHDVKRTLEQDLKERSSFELPNGARIEYSASDFLDYLREYAPEIAHCLVGSYLVDLLLTSVYYREELKKAWGVSWLPYSTQARNGNVRLLLSKEWPGGDSKKGILHFLNYLFETNKVSLMQHEEYLAYAKELMENGGNDEWVAQEVKRHIQEEIGSKDFLNKRFIHTSLDAFSRITPEKSFFEYFFVERLQLPYLFSKNDIFLDLNTLQIYSHEEECGSVHQTLVDYLLGIVYCPDVKRVNYAGWFRVLQEVSVKEGTVLVPEQLLTLFQQSLAHFRTQKNLRKFCELLGFYVNREGPPYLLHATLFFSEYRSLLSPKERIEIEYTLFRYWKKQKYKKLLSPTFRPGPGIEQSIPSLLRSDSLAENCAGLFLLNKAGSRLGEHVNPGASFLKLLTIFHAQKNSPSSWLQFALDLNLQCKRPCTAKEQKALHWLLEMPCNRSDIGPALLRWIQTSGALAGLPLEQKETFFPLAAYSPLETLEELRKNPLFNQEERLIAFLLRFQEGDRDQQHLWALECRSYFIEHPEEKLMLSCLVTFQQQRGKETPPELFPLISSS